MTSEVQRHRVLITGCNSCTGRHLVELLQKDSGAELFGLGRAQSSELPLTYTPCDVRDGDRLAWLLSAWRPTRIYHLAGTADGRDPEGLRAVNVGGTRNLLKACLTLAQGPSVLIVSSCAVYGDLAEGDTASEDDALAPVSVYGKSRVEQEELATRFAKECGLPVYLARPFNLTGSGLANHLVPAALLNRLRDLSDDSDSISLKNARTVRDFVDVRDAVRAYQLILDRGQVLRPYNIGSGSGTSIRQLAATMIAVLGLSLRIIEETKTSAAERSTLLRSVADVERIGKELEWLPVISLSASLAEMCR